MSTTRNIKLTLEYDGTHFNGWQVQDKSKRTVQVEIEKVLSKIFKKKYRITGSGRTDSGVHAKAQVANFKTTSTMTPLQILKALNAWLPEDISVTHAEIVPLSFHAQYSVKSKTYRYLILNRPSRSALERHFSFFYSHHLNLTLVRREAKSLLGKKDFKSFQAADISRSEKKTIRTIKKIQIKKSADFIYIDIEADGFLYKMVRNIVGTLLEIGSGKRPKASIQKILKAKNRKAAGPTAPAQGLCLMEVHYVTNFLKVDTF